MVGTIKTNSQVGSSTFNEFGKYWWFFKLLLLFLARLFVNYFVPNIIHRYDIPKIIYQKNAKTKSFLHKHDKRHE
jgi:hypothetical protein